MIKSEQLEEILEQIEKREDDSESFKGDELEEQFEAAKIFATDELNVSEQEKKKILNSRFNKFYLYNIKKDKANDYLEEKPTLDLHDPDLIVVHQKLLIYGIDFLNRQKIKEYFGLQKNQNINFMTTSCAKIQFGSPERLKLSLQKLILDQQQLQNLSNLKWVHLKPYYEQGLERKLEARLASNKDQFKETNNMDTYIEKETKKVYQEQKKHVNEIYTRYYPNRRRDNHQQKQYQIYEKRQLENPKIGENNKSNLSIPRNEVIDISSDEGEENNQQSESLNNLQHSMELDISVVSSKKSYPMIYNEPKNIHQFEKFKKFSYKTYHQEKQIESKKKQIKLIAIEDE